MVEGETSVEDPRRLLRRLRVLVSVAVLGVYAVVLVRSLRFRFVEGDDAASIAFHTAGRDPDLVPTFGGYHAGTDLMLSVLPTSESVLRVVAIAVSAACTVVAVLLMLELVRIWLSDTPRLHRALLDSGPAVGFLIVGLLAAVPELLFLSLVYLPSMVGFSLVLAAHLTVRRSIEAVGRRHYTLLALACVLAGVGVSARWDMALVAAVGVGDLVFMASRSGNLARAQRISVIWALGAVAVFGVVLLASPATSGLTDVIGTAGDRAGVRTPLRNVVANTVSLFTPALLVLCAVGLTTIRWRWRAFLLGQFVVAAGLAAFLSWSVPKVFLAFFPALLFAVSAGLIHLWDKRNPKVLAGLVALVMLPWLVGVQVTPTGDTAWGPGFEIQPFDRADSERTYGFGFGAGSAVPTPEGPRSLWGFGQVLFGGGWPDLTDQRADEHAEAVTYGLERGLPLMQLEGGIGAVVTTLASLGLNPAGPVSDHPRFGVQGFIGSGQATLVDLDDFGIFSGDFVVPEAVVERIGTGNVVVFGYPSTMRDLYRIAPMSVVPLGVETAVLDLDLFAMALRSG